jgi:ADP-ribose pyrophosphatase YjhB (NUDIX family)
MKHRIRAAALVVSNGRLLLVRHRHPQTGTDWWVPPGGGLEQGESIFQCAERETYEESGVTLELDRIMYIGEFIDLEQGHHNLEVFILARSFQGELTTGNLRPEDLDSGYVKEARFLSPAEMRDLTVFPEILKDGFWRDLAAANTGVKYLGLKSGDTRLL